MQNQSKKWLLIGGAMALTMALYFAPKKNISDKLPSALEGGKSDEQTWLTEAHQAFGLFLSAQNEEERTEHARKAIHAFEEALKINPENLDAKADLGLCYAVATEDPMKGIMMLREVVDKNPRHEQGQFNLGVLSLQSGQYDKAIERFNTVLRINPNNKDAEALKAEAEKRK